MTGNGDDRKLADRLVTESYQELRAIAHRLMQAERPGHLWQATALVHEAFERLAKRPDFRYQSRPHLVAVTVLQMRRALGDYARRAAADKRPDNRLRVTLADDTLPPNERYLDLLELSQALEALEQVNVRHCRVFEFRALGGLTVEECADELGVSARTIKSDWRFARVWVADHLRGGAGDANGAGGRAGRDTGGGEA